MADRDLTKLYDAIIIGGGPAGLTAALYLARARYRVLVIEKEKFGGQITITEEIVNYPGVKKTSGTELTATIREQAESFGAEFLLADVSEVNFNGSIKSVVAGGKKLEAYGVLIATGAHPRMIGFEGEAEFKGHGVAYCATCDGEFFTDKEIFVVGGGFAAAEESVFLTKYAKQVTILMRGDDFSCAAAVADKARENPKISILTNTEVVKVEGDDRVRTIVYRNNKNGEETRREAGADDNFGVFVLAGYEPATDLFAGQIELDRGYVVTDTNKKTNVDGVYAAGDVCIKNLRQVVTAVGDGALAATELERWAKSMQEETGVIPKFQAPASREVAANENAETPASSAGGKILNAAMVAQLNTVFAKMEGGLKLKLFLDERPVSSELEAYMTELCDLSEKLELSVASESDNSVPEDERPCVKIYRENGEDSGLAFHGVPGGHEFSSFVLGLYNVAGPGQEIDEELVAKIKAIDHEISMRILVSLTCTMCPDLVAAAQKIASLNDKIRVDVYDINHFGALRDKYNVMSVPCFVVNEGKPQFGKKTVGELIEILTQKQN